MTGSVALDVVIGLVFIYSLYSLLTTTLVEIAANFIRLRATFLEYGIRRMLDDNAKEGGLSKLFFKQPMIKYLGSGNLWGLVKKPSYLSAQNFSKTLIDIMKEAGVKKPEISTDSPTYKKIQALLSSEESVIKGTETRKFIRSLMEDAQGDLEKFKSSIEKWYDDTMERVASWYKKWIQLITFAIALIVAGIFNVDTLKIVEELSHNPVAREQFIVMAQKLVEDKEVIKAVYGKDSTKAYEDLKSTMGSLRTQALEANNVLSIERSKDKCGNTIYVTFGSFLGWLITAIALSLGAPFWFDLLNKLMKLRGSVKSATTANAVSEAESTPKINRVG